MNIPIKIRAGKTAPRPEPKPEEKPLKGKAFKPVWLISLALIFILAVSGLIMFVRSRPFSPFEELVPAEAIGVAYFSQEKLAQSLNVLGQRNYDWQPFASAQSQIKELAAKNGFELGVLAGFFEDNMALVLLPPPGPSEKNAGQPGWLCLARTKDQAALGSALDRAADEFKRNYNLSAENYRQIKVTEVKALNQNQAGLFYVLDQNYFLASSNLEVLKATIDKIINQ